MFTISGHDRYYSQMNLGFSNLVLLWISVGGFTIIFIILGYLMVKINPDEIADRGRNPNDPVQVDLLSTLRGEEYNDALLNADVSTLNRAQRRARAKLQMKKYRRLETPANRLNALEQEPVDAGGMIEIDDHIRERENEQHQQQGDDMNNGDHDVHGEGEIHDHPSLHSSSTTSRKERQRLAKVQEKEERKLYEEIRREKTRLVDELLSREKRDREKATSEMHERLALERRQQAYEQQERKKMMFAPSSTTNVSLTVEDFVNDVIETKRISLDTMAKRFAVSKEDLIHRIRQLEDEDRIPMPGGVFDVKYQYYTLMSDDDMRALITRFKNSGPMSLSSFGKECEEVLNANQTIVNF